MAEEQKKEFAIPKAYEPKTVEEKWYRYWMDEGFFQADASSSKPAYCIVMPPPNVTGALHMGHALVSTLQDVLTRWKRMCGFEVLWMPGTDHGGISTQTVVERDLIARTGKRAKEFTREEFLAYVWKWARESETQILSQLKRLGCSCDWSRLCFTMDEPRNRAVRVVFKKMFDEGLIYRGDYLVNWDPITQTAIADDEVEHEERASFLWYFRYPLEDKSGTIIIATTRPETMLGDTAVAVNPNDTRYKFLIGKNILHPITNRIIPIVADHLIDPEFGTGAVKITPAHDYNDYEMSFRQKLPMINIMTPDGKINENGLEFAGLKMEEARKAVVKKLSELGFLERIEPHTHRVGISYRSKAVIEPFLSKQWYVKMSHFKENLISAVKDKRVKLIPSSWENTYFHWIENLRDWCISRQLWWGHRIPIWYRKDNPEVMICYDGEGNPPEVEKNPGDWAQDEDVLDTWFSSALWPFSTMGWPEETPDLKKFYPTSTLITGHDILFFWVARMILMGEYILNKPPFHETFLHGLIYGKSYWRYQKDGSIAYASPKERASYDMGQPVPAEVHSKWEKMSKSKGNIIDPLEIIDSFGTDAMRMALSASATHARQIDLDRRRFEEFKNFANKVWNGARFVFMNIESLAPHSLADGLKPELFTLEDKWILSLLNRTISEVNAQLQEYAFDKAANVPYEFFWKHFCAYYVELVKPVLFGKAGNDAIKENKQKILTIVLCNVLRLMHPMAPNITEELFQLLKKQFPNIVPKKECDSYTLETIQALSAPACIVAPYPKVISEKDMNKDIESAFSYMEEMVHAIRTIRAEMQLPPGLETDLYIIGDSQDPQWKIVQENQGIIPALVRTKNILMTKEEKPLKFSASSLVGNLKLVIPLPEEMREKEKIRLIKERDKLIEQQNSTREQLANDDFVQKAPAPLVEKAKQTLLQTEKELVEVMKKLDELSVEV